FDLPDAPRPPEDSPAPPRFLPEFDNLLLSHANRRRVLADEHRARVFLPGLRVAPTFLVDGFVAGTWKVTRAKAKATLVLEPFASLAKAVRAAIADEAMRLVAFVEEDASTFDVRFA
ncbi:MAG: winged helix DNA-binding domain-containing protein, partial [Polyangiaceae bacterium]|nr:winged helix DNA-binding domain-containing protein [Polyangiaceae bacterium]